MFSVLVIRLRSLRLLRVSGIVMRLRMFLLLITFLKASHSFRNRLLVIWSFVSGAMAKAGKGLLEGTLQAGTSAVSDKLLDLVGLGGKSAADKGKDTRDYLAAAFPELNAWERAGADASSAGMVDAGF